MEKFLLFGLLLFTPIVSFSEENLLLLVIRNEISKVEEILVGNNDLDINSTNNRFSSPALLFCKDEQMTKLLLDHGAEVDTVGSKQGMSALMEAARNGNIKQAKLLIDAGAQVNLKDHYGRTALHYSAGNLNVKLPDYLINHNAYIDAQDYEGNSVLMRAVYHGDIDFLRLLIKSGVNQNLLNKNELSAENLIDLTLNKRNKAIIREIFINAKESRREEQSQEEGIANSPSFKYKLSAIVDSTKGEFFQCVNISILSRCEEELSVIETGASNAMKWAVGWMPNDDIVVFSSSDTGTYAYGIDADGHSFEIKINKQIKERGNFLLAEKYKE